MSAERLMRRHGWLPRYRGDRLQFVATATLVGQQPARVYGHGVAPIPWGRARMIASDMIEIPYIFSGFSVGFIVGMTGVGGGSLMTPLLVLLFGLHPATAVGTDLLYAAITKSCGMAVHHI